MGDLRIESIILGATGPVLCFPFFAPHLRRFRVFIDPRAWCWLLMYTPTELPRGPKARYGSVRSRNFSRGHEERRGSVKWQNYDEIPKFQQFMGRSFVFLASPPHIRRFRVFSVSALGVGS